MKHRNALEMFSRILFVIIDQANVSFFSSFVCVRSINVRQVRSHRGVSSQAGSKQEDDASFKACSATG